MGIWELEAAAGCSAATATATACACAWSLGRGAGPALHARAQRTTRRPPPNVPARLRLARAPFTPPHGDTKPAARRGAATTTTTRRSTKGGRVSAAAGRAVLSVSRSRAPFSSPRRVCWRIGDPRPRGQRRRVGRSGNGKAAAAAAARTVRVHTDSVTPSGLRTTRQTSPRRQKTGPDAARAGFHPDGPKAVLQLFPYRLSRTNMNHGRMTKQLSAHRR